MAEAIARIKKAEQVAAGGGAAASPASGGFTPGASSLMRSNPHISTAIPSAPAASAAPVSAASKAFNQIDREIEEWGKKEVLRIYYGTKEAQSDVATYGSRYLAVMIRYANKDQQDYVPKGYTFRTYFSNSGQTVGALFVNSKCLDNSAYSYDYKSGAAAKAFDKFASLIQHV